MFNSRSTFMSCNRRVIVLVFFLMMARYTFGQVVPLDVYSISDSTPVLMYVYSKTPYDSALKEIDQKRQAFKSAYLLNAGDSITSDSIITAAGSFFSGALLRIAPYWFGTKWDFNGYTNSPGRGVIACGYFVSTTLKHLGVNVNRYHLAQQNPLNEAKSIARGDSVRTRRNVSPVELGKTVFEKEGLYFVGLDNHVGYVLSYRSFREFIHSNYIGSAGVVAEDIYSSEAFKSTSYYIAPISANKQFILDWILSKPVEVIRG